MLKPPPFLASLLLPALLVGCGKDSKTNPAAVASSSSANAAQAGCSNPVAVSAVPASWKAVSQKDLVGQGTGTWYLTQVTLHGVHAEGSQTASATTITGIDNSGNPSTNITCNSVPENAELDLLVSPQERISQSDGTFAQRRTVAFQLRGSHGLRKRYQLAPSSSDEKQFVLTADQRKAQGDALKAQGGTYQAAYYRVNAREFEMRATITKATTGRGSDTVNLAAHYQLR